MEWCGAAWAVRGGVRWGGVKWGGLRQEIGHLVGRSGSAQRRADGGKESRRSLSRSKSSH